MKKLLQDAFKEYGISNLLQYKGHWKDIEENRYLILNYDLTYYDGAYRVSYIMIEENHLEDLAIIFLQDKKDFDNRIHPHFKDIVFKKEFDSIDNLAKELANMLKSSSKEEQDIIKIKYSELKDTNNLDKQVNNSFKLNIIKTFNFITYILILILLLIIVIK